MPPALILLLVVYVGGVVAAGGLVALIARRLPGGAGDRALPALLRARGARAVLAGYWLACVIAVAALAAG